MHQDIYVLIDIGGTAIKSGIATLDGTLLERNEIPTEAKPKGPGIVEKVKNITAAAIATLNGAATSDKTEAATDSADAAVDSQNCGGPGIVKKVKKITQAAIDKYGADIKGVSISTAGMVDPDQGKIVYALPDAIPDYTGVNFKEIITREFSLPCEVENDVNCAALGEMWLGAGRGCHSVFCMTIGTSIGGAMICNGNLISGSSNSAGEIAYMRIPGGILHSLASTTYLVKYYAELRGESVENVNGIRIFNEAEAGDEVAVKAIDELIEHLTDGITNVVSVQNPQAVILGGGIMAREDYLRPRIEAALKEKLRDIVFRATRIEFAKLRNDAGMLGGFYNFKQRRNLM